VAVALGGIVVGVAGGVSVAAGVSVGVEVGLPVAVAVNVAIRPFVGVGDGAADPVMRDPSEQPRVPSTTTDKAMMSGRDLPLMIQPSSCQ
jgi:hypothetical protein